MGALLFSPYRADKETGEISEMHISNIELLYDADRARLKREAQELKKAKKIRRK